MNKNNPLLFAEQIEFLIHMINKGNAINIGEARADDAEDIYNTSVAIAFVKDFLTRMGTVIVQAASMYSIIKKVHDDVKDVIEADALLDSISKDREGIIQQARDMTNMIHAALKKRDIDFNEFISLMDNIMLTINRIENMITAMRSIVHVQSALYGLDEINAKLLVITANVDAVNSSIERTGA